MNRCFITMFAAALAATSANAQPNLTPQQFAARQLEVLADVIKPDAVAIESSVTGYGLIVGTRGGELLIATAAHVVVPANSPQVSVRVFLDDSQVVRLIGVAYPDESLNSGEDLEFVSISRPAGHPLIPYTAQPLRSDGQFATHLGKGGEWQSARIAGQLFSTPVANALIFRGLDIQETYSGGPVIGQDGIVGIFLRRRGLGEAQVLGMDAIKARFDATFAPRGWTWLPRPAPPPRPLMGYLRLTRADRLGGVFILSAPGRPVVAAPSNQLAQAPVGRYGVKAQTPAGNDLTCEPRELVIDATHPLEVTINCNFDLAGDWLLGPARLELRHLGGPRFSARLSGQAFLSGSGTANFDGSTLALTINRDQGGTWSANLNVTPDSLSGWIEQATFYLGPQKFPLGFFRTP